jgi:toxin CcdB
MTQHDLFANPNRKIRAAYPLIVLLQARVADGETQVVAPLIRDSVAMPKSRLLPIVDHDGTKFVVAFGLITHLPGRLLRHPVGSIAQYRDDLSRALDWLFFGI